MLERQLDTMENPQSDVAETSVSVGEVKENTQITVKDTGWSEKEKERMKAFGYDGLDMVRAWYG